MNTAATKNLPDLAAPIWFGPERFWRGDDYGLGCSMSIDITGRARILLYGPLSEAPAGRWRASVEFSLCADAATRAFQLCFGPIENLAALPIQPTGAGRYRVEIENVWPVDGHFDLRLVMTRPAFHGALSFHGAEFSVLD